MHEIGVFAWRDAGEQRVRLEIGKLVPAHVRDLEMSAAAVGSGLDAHHVALQPIEAGMDTVFDAASGHELHADADVEKGLAALDHRALTRVDTALPAVQS